MLKRIADWLVLTKTERNVILFLSITLLVGAGIRLYQTTFPSAPRFDYRESDSIFASLSTVSEDSVSALTKEIGKEKSGKLDINTATKQEFIDLPGIGEVTAERILKYRKEKGKFISVEDLRTIKGMSKKRMEQLKPLITAQ